MAYGVGEGCEITCADTTPEIAEGLCDDVEVEIPEIPDDLEDIDLPDANTVTTEDVDGTGVFDIYMRAGMNQLMTQYDQDRIKGADFAAAYTAMVQLMMTEANKFVIALVQAEIAAKMFPIQYLNSQYQAALSKEQAKKMIHESDLVCQQVAELKENGAVDRELKRKQTITQTKQAELYQRQKQGFDEKYKTDLFTQAVNAWSVQAAQVLSVTDATIPELSGKLTGDMISDALTKAGLHLPNVAG